MSPAQINAIRNATTISVGPAVGLKIGVQLPSATASVGAEASIVAQNGPNGVETVTTLEAGAKIESSFADAKAQLFKVEEKSDSSSGVPKVTSLTKEGPRLNGELKSGAASVSSQGEMFSTGVAAQNLSKAIEKTALQAQCYKLYSNESDEAKFKSCIALFN